jgi:hypothetical protein
MTTAIPAPRRTSTHGWIAGEMQEFEPSEGLIRTRSSVKLGGRYAAWVRLYVDLANGTTTALQLDPSGRRVAQATGPNKDRSYRLLLEALEAQGIHLP